MPDLQSGAPSSILGGSIPLSLSKLNTNNMTRTQTDMTAAYDPTLARGVGAPLTQTPARDSVHHNPAYTIRIELPGKRSLPGSKVEDIEGRRYNVQVTGKPAEDPEVVRSIAQARDFVVKYNQNHTEHPLARLKLEVQ